MTLLLMLSNNVAKAGMTLVLMSVTFYTTHLVLTRQKRSFCYT